MAVNTFKKGQKPARWSKGGPWCLLGSESSSLWVACAWQAASCLGMRLRSREETYSEGLRNVNFLTKKQQMRLRNEHIQMSAANRKRWLLYFFSIPKVPTYFLAWEIPSNDRSPPISWVNALPSSQLLTGPLAYGRGPHGAAASYLPRVGLVRGVAATSVGLHQACPANGFLQV